MRVSEAEAGDLAQILRDLNYADEAQPIVLATPTAGGMSPASRILVGAKGDKLIAATLVVFDGISGWVAGIWVTRSHQKQGFGTTIVAEAEKWLRLRGAASIYLQIPFTNLSLISFYDKLGYPFNNMVLLGKAF